MLANTVFMKKLAITALVLLTAACTNHSHKENKDGVERNVVEINMSSLWSDINSTVVEKDDIIKIRLKKSHENQLAVKTPEGKFYFIAMSPKEQMNAIYSSEEFQNLKSIELNVNSLKLVPYQYQKVEKERVFNKKGTYQFMLSENLETEVGAKIREVEFLGR
jgi:hypothetical protein